mmetsp:Transcript_58325/g.161275  ORF Transcript_58325/g.161275 Transcript_58325/m.161275 type:complete len:248 (-) Transcript_58325:686-1429(-)
MEDRVEVGLSGCMPIAISTAVHFELYMSWQLAGSLVANLRHLLQGLPILCTLGHPQLDGHEDLPATFSALLLLVAHADNLAAKGCVCILWHLDLLWWTTPTILAMRSVRVCAAATAECQAPELEVLVRSSLHKLLGRYRHLDLDGVTSHLLLQLWLHDFLVHLRLFLLDLLLKGPPLGMVLGDFVQLGIHLRPLAFQFFEGCLHVPHQLHTPQVVVSLAVWITEDFVGIADLIEYFHVTALVWMVLD